MTIEVVLLISIVSVIFSVYQVVSGNRRNQKCDDRNEASQLTTVIVKLENIGTGVTEIKGELGNVKLSLQEDRERIIINEESVKSAHKRLDALEKHGHVEEE